jgi:hypothetical protein
MGAFISRHFWPPLSGVKAEESHAKARRRKDESRQVSAEDADGLRWGISGCLSSANIRDFCGSLVFSARRPPIPLELRAKTMGGSVFQGAVAAATDPSLWNATALR